MSLWYVTYKNDDLIHHGIKGMKWGVRRYQNPDGSLTSAGRNRYSSDGGSYMPSNIKKTGSKAKEAQKNKFTRRQSIRREYIGASQSNDRIPLTYDGQSGPPGGGSYFVVEAEIEERLHDYATNGDENDLDWLLNYLSHMDEKYREKYLEKIKKYPDVYKTVSARLNPRNRGSLTSNVGRYRTRSVGNSTSAMQPTDESSITDIFNRRSHSGGGGGRH